MVVVCCCCWLTLLFAGLLFTHSVKEGPTLTWWEWIFGENVQGWAGKVFSMIHICMGVRGRCVCCTWGVAWVLSTIERAAWSRVV